MAKSRGFLVVLHDTHKTLYTKPQAEEVMRKLSWRQYVIAKEPYEHQAGYHIHIFYQVKNPVRFKSQLAHWCAAFRHPEGRVHVDVMRGDMAQACKYLVPNATQDAKLYDPDPIIMLDPTTARAAEVHSALITLESLATFPIHYWNLETQTWYEDWEPFERQIKLYRAQHPIGPKERGPNFGNPVILAAPGRPWEELVE